ncbi:Signal transducer regulating beta-lactamase production, contains metallopeptidase domain [Anaerovirgula multivorans]|uniref:Signal transducer regulating beta-lactamase production, contains metallopeptidase domain n=1 Tax=Anaerovirgula multivorans TaxID=312168 RepID=A0A239F6Y3_9FIRM|nr:M56 family metallopeptidase [Anaerovirgula multivorans]SNS52228.1 Signal transducer regulating beta-lactamase production, contains metallopeptidase domain [Anaerovirgula multivorans]
MMGAIFLKLLNMNIATSWLILTVIVLRLFMKRAPKWIPCILWAIVAVRLVFPFSFESIFSLIPSAETIPVQGIYSSNSIAANEPYNFQLQSGIQMIDRAINPIDLETTGSAMRLNIEIFAWIWFVGAVLLLLYAIISYLRMRRKVWEAVLLRDSIWLCDAVKSPFILGIIRPQIYLPSGIPEGQVNYVLAHEQAHLKHKDHWWKPLGFLLLTVYWFNPLVGAAYILFCRDIELACDEAVIKNMKIDEKKAYSYALVSCSMQRKMVMVCPLAFGEVGVKERIKTVLNYKKPAFWTVVVAVVACVVVAVCFLTNPKEQDKPIETPLEGTDYSGYDELIAQARDVLENFDGNYPEEEPFSSVFYQNWDYETLGYLIKDIDGNGIDELIFGANTDGWDNGSWDGVIYDIYTIVNGEVFHVLDGWERNRYYLCKNGCIANEGSSSAFESSYNYYTYSGTELPLVESILYYSLQDEEHPWFYSTEDEPDIKNAEPISQDKAAEIMNKYVHEHPQYTPFVG